MIVAFNNSQYLVVVKLMKKDLGTQIWAETGPKISFFAIFSGLVH